MKNSVRKSTQSDELRFDVTNSDGSQYSIDLSEFARGGKIDEMPTKVQHAWRGDFTGRPELAREFAAMIVDNATPKKTSVAMRYGLRELFRFFDHNEAAGAAPISSISDVTDGHGAAFLIWLGPDRASAYRAAKAAMDALRAFYEMRTLSWPAREADAFDEPEPLRPEAVKALYKIAKLECRGIKSMLKEGTRLAADGTSLPTWESKSDHWSEPENRAWLVQTATADRLLDKAELKALGYYDPLAKHKGLGPSYIAPLMGIRGQVGWSAALR